MDKASADTYWDYFRVLEECLAHWTTPAKVRAGWQKMAGTWPIDKDQILSSCSQWSLLQDEQSRTVIRNVIDHPDLQRLALRGFIHDSELDAIITEPLAGIIEVDPETRKPHGVATSHSRCVHLTNTEYRDLMVARHIHQTEQEVERLAAEYERFTNAEKKEQEEERKETSRQQIAAIDNDQQQLVVGSKRKRMTVVNCSNPCCKATCYKDDYENKNTWNYCYSSNTTPKKKCKIVFCPADSCREMLLAHKEVCK